MIRGELDETHAFHNVPARGAKSGEKAICCQLLHLRMIVALKELGLTDKVALKSSTASIAWMRERSRVEEEEEEFTVKSAECLLPACNIARSVHPKEVEICIIAYRHRPTRITPLRQQYF